MPDDRETTTSADATTDAPDQPTTAPPTTAPPTTAVSLVEFPIFENSVLVDDVAGLDELASRYAAEVDPQPEMERFLFGYVAVEAFDSLLTATPDTDQVGRLLWQLHVSGYFGGRWLRGEIEAAQPDALLVSFSNPPTAETFARLIDRAAEAVAAATAADADALAYARASLFDTPNPDGEPIRGLADNFGYNQGYLLQILEAPPEGIAASPEYDITCEGTLACTYATARLQSLGAVADVQAALAADSAYAELAAEILPIQEAAVPRGRAVWNGGLSVQGFSQRSYDQLLDVSSSYLETVQATALTMARAVVEADADAARRGAAANAGMIVWLGGYFAGLTNGEGEIELPAFVTE